MARDERRGPLIRLGKSSWPTSTLISYRYKQLSTTITAAVTPVLKVLKITKPIEMQVISSAEDIEIFSMPIENKEDLQYKFSQCLIRKPWSLSSKEQRHFKEVYTRFQEAEKMYGQRYWSESTLTHFLKLRAPSDLASIVQDAGPLLYRTVLHLGSYPYHLHAENKLTADVSRTAVILILCKYRFRGWTGEKDRKFCVEFLEKKNRRLLFQSMMQGSYPNEKNQNQRSDEDDEDLLEVLQALQELDKGKDEGVLEGEKKLHLRHDLPSSNSTELGGSIPHGEFRNFVRLMLLYRFPFGLAEPSLLEIDTAADAIMESFASEDDGLKVEAITWPAFDRALKETMPYLTRGLLHLFSNFIQPSSHTHKPNLTTAEKWGFPAPPTGELYRRLKPVNLHWGPSKCPRDPELPPIPYNPKLSFGVMAQLAMCIPSTTDVRYHIQQLPRAWLRPTRRGGRNSLVFISGTRIPTPDSNDTCKVVICGYIGRRGDDETFEVEGRKLFIQLAPIYRVFTSGDRAMVDVEMFTETHFEVEPTRGWFSLWRENEHISHVGIEDKKWSMKVKKLGEGPASGRDDQEETVAEEEFTVDEVKLFCFAS